MSESSDPDKEYLLTHKLHNPDPDIIGPIVARMTTEETGRFLRLNNLIEAETRLTNSKADAIERALSAVSREDIKDFMALHGVGSLDRQIGTRFKRNVAEGVSGCLVSAMILAIILGLLFMALVAVSVH
jgi:hypothetical protein